MDETQALAPAELRNQEIVFWSIIWYCRISGLSYDLFLPYKEEARKSLLLQKKLVREKTASKLNVSPEKENPWFDQFKQIRVFALCKDESVGTEDIDKTDSQKLQADVVKL